MLKKLERIAIISTRLGGIDGVSVEAEKWAKAYSMLGLEPLYIAGDTGVISSNFFRIEEMDYYHPDIEKIRIEAFSKLKRNETITLKDWIPRDDLASRTEPCISTPPGNWRETDNSAEISDETFDILNLRKRIDNLKNIIKKKLLNAIAKNKVSYFSVENALSIPLNIPLGIALTEIIVEEKIPTITRHHDFYWEREEFLGSPIEDILGDYFPPDLPNVKHVVINTLAQKSLFSRKGIKATYIPNVFDFGILNEKRENPSIVRGYLNVREKDYLFLQPTRIIRRKRIERSIELVEKLSKILNRNIFLFITGKPEKSEMDYFHDILAIADKKKVNLILSEGEGIGTNYSNSGYGRRNLKEGIFKRYNIFDLYNCCDLVTLPSDIEGFGNPVIEACAFRKPLFVNNYPVLSDMLSKGFDFVVIDGQVSSSCVKKIMRLLTEDSYREKVVERNFKIAYRFYSMEFLIKELEKVLKGFICLESGREA